MGTGAGIVTDGKRVPARSLNCMLKFVMTRPAAPFVFRTTTNGTVNGDTVGQNGRATGCATMLSDSALIETFDEEDDEPAGPNVVGVVGRLESLHDAAMSAAQIKNASGM